MRYTFILFFSILLDHDQLTAQSNKETVVVRPTNALSIELGRTGLIANISYERLIINHRYGLRADAGKSFGRYLSLSQAGIGAFALTGNACLTGEAGMDIHYISVDNSSDDQNPGLGFVYPDYSISQLCPALLIGGRRYKRQSLFRLGIAGVLIRKKLIPGGYVSLGKTF